MKMVFAMMVTLCLALPALAGFQGYNGTSNVGVFNRIKCSTGLTCTASGDKFQMISSPTMTGTQLTLSGTLAVTGVSTLTGGVSNGSGKLKNFSHGYRPAALTSGTSTTPSATTVYLTQIYVPVNATLTGVKVSNGATVGTDKYIVALFDSSGAKLANSALAGTTTSGADSYQALPFTATYDVKGPGVYWIGLYVNGTTDRFRTIPAAGEYGGYAGSATGQSFGTVATVTPPTSFTADKGPVAFTY
jgi:hypothetical protein